MGDHSDWRPYPGDPSSVLGWTLLSVAQEFSRVMVWTVLAVVIAGLTALLLMLVGVVDAFDFGTGWSLPTRRRRAPQSLAYLAPVPSRDPWYPVRVRVLQDGVPTGFDDGIAIFGDGWLHVEGRRTMFSIPSEHLSLAHCGGGCTLVLPGQTLELQPYDRMGDDRRLSSAFDLAIRHLRVRPCTAVAVMRRPPLQVHPWAFGRAWGGLVLGVLLVAIAVIPIALYGWLGCFIGAVVVTCGCWRAGLGIWELWRLRMMQGCHG